MKLIQRLFLPVLLLLRSCTPAYAATPLVGGVRFNSDSTGTNTQSGGVTITLSTNLNAGKVVATNSVVVGQGSTRAGVLDLYSTNGTYIASLTVDTDGTFQILYGTTNLFTVANPSGHDGSGTNFLSDDGTYKPVTGLTINSTDGRVPKRQNSTTFADTVIDGSTDGVAAILGTLQLSSNGVVYLQWTTNGVMLFGPGTTNVLYRSGTALVYTNGDSTVDFNVVSVSGGVTTTASLESTIGAAVLKSSGAGVKLQNTTKQLTYLAGALIPNSSSTDDKLGENVADEGWDEYWTANGGSIYVVGSGLGTSNYERLKINHQGSSGVVFDSLAGGSGTVRNINLKFGGTQRYGFGSTGSLTGSPASTNNYIFWGTGFYADASGQLELNSGGGGGPHVHFSPWETTLPFYIGSARTVAALTAFYSLKNNGTNILEVLGDGSTKFYGDPVPATDNTKSLGGAANRWVNTYTIKVTYTTGVFDSYGSGSPEGAVTANVGSTYRRTDGGAGTSFYIKESGTGNTGWVAK